MSHSTSRSGQLFSPNKRYISPTPRSLYKGPGAGESQIYESPPYSDLRTKLTRRNVSRSRSPTTSKNIKSSNMKVRDDRSMSRSPRSSSKQPSGSRRRSPPSPGDRTLSPSPNFRRTPYQAKRRNSGDKRYVDDKFARSKAGKSRSRSPRSHSGQRSRSRRVTPTLTKRMKSPSPQFRTPYRPRSASNNGHRAQSSSGRKSPSKRSSDRDSSQQRYDRYERSSSKFHEGKSSSRVPSKSSSRMHDRSSSHRRRTSPNYETPPRQVVVASPDYNPIPSTSTVVAGVDVDSNVNKILQKIVAKTDKKKRKKMRKQKMEMELVLRTKKKKTKKPRSDETPVLPQVKSEPITDHEPADIPSNAISIKTEPGIAPASPPPPAAAVIKPSNQYFKPKMEVELQPILGHTKCRICKSYYPDTDDKRNHHLAQHPDRVFLVNLPVDTYYFDMEEAISHMARFGINRVELQQKVKECNLIKLPSNLKGFSCDVCQTLDTNSEKEFNIHVKEECKVVAKEERAKHFICFCRGCQSKFSNKFELERHIGVGGCWPSMMVINRLYDMTGVEVAAKTKDKVTMDKEKMVKIKQEKLERAQQIQIKRERFEDRDQIGPPPSQDVPRFNAYSMPSSQDGAPGPSKVDLHRILQSVQPNQVMPNQVMQDMANANFQKQLNLANMQYMQGIQPMPSMQFPPPTLVPQQIEQLPPMNYSVQLPYPQAQYRHPPPSYGGPQQAFRSGAASPPDVVEPSPAYSPLRETLRSRSRQQSMSVVVPPAPNTPLPPVDDLFTGGPSTRRGPPVVRQRCPSGDSIASCESSEQSQQSMKMVSISNCQWSACMWTDPHTSTCKKLAIMEKCSTDSCEWYDLHRDSPLCDKLSFYCNCKKESEGVYKYYDSLRQVKKIPTEMLDGGDRDLAVKEKKSVVMRLLYKVVNKVIQDPRLARRNYPTPRNIPARSFRGKGKRGWGENCVICTWSGVSMVLVRSENNPHVISDHESDVEFCGEEDGERNRGKKLTKRMERASSTDSDIC